MQRQLKTIAILGFLVIIIPFFGIPLAWKQWVLLLLGGAIMTLALLARRSNPRASGEQPASAGTLADKPYADNGYEMATNDE